MCGLIGYVGTEPALPRLYYGLDQMENRGYDSTGIGLMNGGPPERVRALRPDHGKVIDSLRPMLGEMRVETIGIGHTRWASHGRVCIENAHPHIDCTGRLLIAHNGNIENYGSLLKRLSTKHHIATDVDSELIAHLIEEFLLDRVLLAEAARMAYQAIEGALGFVAMSADDPTCLVAVRRSSPILVGKDETGTYVSSEQSGFPPTVKTFIELKDDDMAILRADGFKIKTLDGHDVRRQADVIDLSVHDERPAHYTEHTQWEIHSEPKAVRDTLAGRLQVSEGMVKLGGLESVRDQLRDVEHVCLIGCGTAYHACMLGARMLTDYAGIPAQAHIASEFVYDGHHCGPKSAVVAVSQSGESADTRQALDEARRRGALTLGVVNVVGSAIARETTAGIYTRAGRERGVASTKAFLSQVVTLAMLTIHIGRQRSMIAAEAERLTRGLDDLALQLEFILEEEAVVRDLAHLITEGRGCVFVGRRMSYPVALEGALKLRELSYLFTEGCPAGELKHGHLALIDSNTPTVAIAPRDSVYERTLTSLEEIKVRQGPIIAIGDKGDMRLRTITDHIIHVSMTHEALHPVLTACVTHLLAYHVAKQLGRDVDRPRCLAKAVTVT